MKKTKTIIFIATLLILLLGLTVISATNITDDTTPLVVEKSSDAVNTPIVSVDKPMKEIKKESKTHVVTNDTVSNVFSKEGTSPFNDVGFNASLLGDDVLDGDTLDFQGTITGNYNLSINKAVNIISSTNDALINLNTTCGGLLGTSPGNHFIIGSEGSYTNVTGIKFYNTQLIVYNSTHVTLDHINATVSGNPVGGGIGQTSIRANSTYITVKNSYFYTENNGGSSTFVLAWADYCDIINNTINAGSGAGNLFYFTTYNVKVPSGTIANSNNRIINNTIGDFDQNFGGIQLACVLSGANKTIEGNIIASDIADQYGGAEHGGYTILNNNTINGGFGTTSDNTTITNNNMKSLFVAHDSIIENNTVDYISLEEGSSTVNNNRIGNIDVVSSNNNITNNNISGVGTIDGSTNQIVNNTIINSEDYTLDITGTNNVVTGNYLVARTSGGDKTVRSENNNISDNTPVTNIYEITDETYSNFFDENGFFNSTQIQNYDTIQLLGEFQNKSFILNNTKHDVVGVNCTIYNGQIKTTDNGIISLENLTIINDDTITQTIVLNGDSNIIRNNNITHTTQNNANLIESNGKNNKILNNTITIKTIENTSPNEVTAIIVGDDETIVEYNNITLNTSSNTMANVITFNDTKNSVNNTRINYNHMTIISAKNSSAIKSKPAITYMESFYNEINITSDNADAIILNKTGDSQITRNTIDIKVTGNASAITMKTSPEYVTEFGNDIRYNTINIEADNINAINVLSDTMNTNGTYIYYNDLNLIANNTTAMTLMGTGIAGKNNINITSPAALAVHITNANKMIFTDVDTMVEHRLNVENGTIAIIENSNNSYIQGHLYTDRAIKYTNVTNLNLEYGHGTFYGYDREVISKDEYAIIFDSCENVTVRNWYLLSDNETKVGDNTIKVIDGNNVTIKDNIPVVTTYLNDETYPSLFDENNVYTGTKQIVVGNITNKTLIFDIPLSIIGEENTTITDSTIKLTENAWASNITQINSYNTQITIESVNTRLSYSNITQNNDMNPVICVDNSGGIYINNNNITGTNTTTLQIKANNSTSLYIQNNNIISYNQSNTPLIILENIGRGEVYNNYLETSDLKGILAIEETNTTMKYSGNLPLYEILLTDDNYNQYFDTESNYIGNPMVEQLTIASNIYNKNFTLNKEIIIDNPENYTIYNTTIQNTGGQITLNNLIINNTNYDNPTIISSAITIIKNTIYTQTNNQEIIILENNSATSSYFDDNKIISIGNNNKIISINNYRFANGQFRYNNITITGDNNTVIYYTKVTSTSYITNNNITVNTDTASTPIIIDNARVRFNQNRIIVTTNQDDTPIVQVITTKNGQVNNNYIESLDLCGNDAVDTPGTKTGNTPTGNKDIPSHVNIEPITLNIGEATEITVSITGSNDMPIKDGKVYFKVNGKVLRDSNNKVVYIDVEEGVATITMNDTTTWTNNTEIKAIFIKSTRYTDSESEAVNPNITMPEEDEPTFTVEDVTTTAGSEVTITVTTKNLDTGKVVLKVNGKTVKADDGKLYAKVTGDTVTFTYTVPKTLKTGEYTIKATYTSGTTKLESESKLTVE